MKKIEFEYKLPARNIEGRRNGTYNNVELALPGICIRSERIFIKVAHWFL